MGEILKPPKPDEYSEAIIRIIKSVEREPVGSEKRKEAARKVERIQEKIVKSGK